MSSGPKRKHSPEFKRQVVDQILSGMKSASQAAREFGVHPSLVHKWVRAFSEGGSQSQTFSTDDRERQRLQAELNRYKQKVGELTLEIDFLKKFQEEQAAAAARRKQEASSSVITGKTWVPSKGRAK